MKKRLMFLQKCFNEPLYIWAYLTYQAKKQERLQSEKT